MKRTLGIIAVAIGLLSAALWLTAKLIPGDKLNFSSQTVIAMAVADAWQRLRDLSLAHNYVPGIVNTELTTTSRTGVGTSRRVYSDETNYINETVIEWHEGSGFSLRLQDDAGQAPFPFSDAAFTYQLQPQGDDETLVKTQLSFTLRGGAIGQWLGEALLSGTFQQSVDDVGAALKQFYEHP